VEIVLSAAGITWVARRSRSEAGRRRMENKSMIPGVGADEIALQ
jgi:hypothetical protein